ncbi:MAG: 16S rRNA (guanine(966)-N(2))-methyltransferase RsmD [Alphaproteobacteria bacterium]|nr:16S rRNA (guanine(966)-N(2))-methyltransferase RsmD [Alphaproteobacteria bacterium]
MCCASLFAATAIRKKIKMRIISGKHRGKKLETPKGMATRPTSDRARESVFNILSHHVSGFSKIAVLDVFAGSGALGLEALSRGAENSIFIDSSKDAINAINKNLHSMKLADKAVVFKTDVLKLKKWQGQPCSLVFLDPPYDENLLVPALVALKEKGWIAEKALCVAEMLRDADFEPPKGFEIFDERTYGKAKIVFLRVL